jgi:hypothetical protein
MTTGVCTYAKRLLLQPKVTSAGQPAAARVCRQRLHPANKCKGPTAWKRVSPGWLQTKLRPKPMVTRRAHRYSAGQQKQRRHLSSKKHDKQAAAKCAAIHRQALIAKRKRSEGAN